MGEKQDKFPTTVKKIVRDTLINSHPKRPKEGIFEWAEKLTQPRTFKVNNVTIHSDLSPIDENKIIEIIGYQNSSDNEKRSHIKEKLFDPIFCEKFKPDTEAISVTFTLSDYPRDSIELLTSQTEVIELKKPDARMRLADVLLAAAG